MPRMRFLIEDILERRLLDHNLLVGDREACSMADRLASEEGLFCGMSSGANVHAALEIARNLPAGSRVVTVLVDHRSRYSAEHPHEHYVV